MKKIAVFLVLLFLLPVAIARGQNPEPLDNAGLQEIIAKNSGKVIMLNFFATWCPPCRTEVPELVKLRNAWPESKLVILGLSVDQNADPVPGFIKKTGINYPVYMAESSITDAYGVSNVPHNAFIAPNGQLVVSEPGMASEPVLAKLVGDLLK